MNNFRKSELIQVARRIRYASSCVAFGFGITFLTSIIWNDISMMTLIITISALVILCMGFILEAIVTSGSSDEG